jgi:alpha-L-rhamnosidase
MNTIAASVLAVSLTCEYRQDPAGILEPTPRLGWQVEAIAPDSRGAAQSAYRILVSDSPERLAADAGDYWDSGWVASAESLWISYAGKPLLSRREMYWKVRLRDEAGREGPWSQVATWRMGTFDADERAGGWIQAAPTAGEGEPDPREAAADFRKMFVVDQPVRRAFVRYMAMGFADVRINGARPDERRRIGPPFTNPRYRVKEVTEEVTHLLREGENVLAVVLGNGYQRPPSGAWNNWQKSEGAPCFLLELELEMPDGTRRLVGTDPTWRHRLGAIVYNDFWMRDALDLRRAQAGWDRPEFDDSDWVAAVSAKEPTGRRVTAHVRPARTHGEAPAQKRDGNRYVFGTIYTGYPKLKVSGKAGDVVRIRSDEVHEVKGFGPLRVDITLAKDGEQWIEPLFTAHTIGPSLTVDGLERLPEPEDVRIVPVHGDLLETGAFECSNPLWNELHAIGRRTHLNYVHHYPNDPTREKAGWSQDIQNMFDSASYLTDTWRMYAAWWRDLADAQFDDGYVSSVAPTHTGLVKTWNDPWWGGMICYAPWRLYEWYGDRAILEEAYEPMKRYVDHLTRLAAESEDGLLHWAGASDWIEVGIEGWGPPKRTPMFLVSTLAWHLYASQLARTAGLLGHAEDAATYRKLADDIRDRFNRICLGPATGLYAKATDSQASLIMPLALGVVPEASQEKMLGRLLENIRERGDHLSTGFVSNPYLLHGLTDLGHADVVARIMNQRDYPSFYSTAAHGVFMETWRGGMAQMPSLGGPCVGWFYRAVLGIRNDPAFPGFARFVIHPEPVDEVDWARGHYDSPRGRIAVDWRKSDGAFTLQVDVPANTRATVHLPAGEGTRVTEGGREIAKVSGIVDLGQRGDSRVLEVGSGRYAFACE